MNYRCEYHEPFSFIGSDIGKIECDNWKFGNLPKTSFQLVYVENYGFLLNMYSEEVNPVADYHNNGDPAYKDSCVEFFANFDPENSEKYLNFEFSAGKLTFLPGCAIIKRLMGCKRKERENGAVQACFSAGI